MPLYEYECRQCHRRMEKIQSFSAEPLTVCESCGGELERLISAPAIQFKGTGWYVTDYAKGSGSGPAPAKSESAPAAPADSKPAAEAKPAAPAAPASGEAKPTS